MLSCKNLPSPWSWGRPVIQLDLPPWCYLVHQLAPSLGPHCSTAEPLYALYSCIGPGSSFCCCCHITAYIALTSSSVSLLLFGVHFWALFGVWWSGQFALDFKHCPGPLVTQLGVTGLSQTSNRMASTHFKCAVLGCRHSKVLSSAQAISSSSMQVEFVTAHAGYNWTFGTGHCLLDDMAWYRTSWCCW